MQFYFDESRENETHTLPDAEVFHSSWSRTDSESLEPGWYWWACFPGCLPDSDPVGPFDTEAEAIEDARSF